MLRSLDQERYRQSECKKEIVMEYMINVIGTAAGIVMFISGWGLILMSCFAAIVFPILFLYERLLVKILTKYGNISESI